MSKALDEFLALRQASEEASAAIRTGRNLEKLETSSRSSERTTASVHGCGTQTDAGASHHEISGYISHTGLNEWTLTAYFEDLLSAHPSARPVKDRRALAEYLARGISHRYPDHMETSVTGDTLLRRRMSGNAEWVARCPAGHTTDDVIESRHLVGWACQVCQRVYDATECQVIPREAPRGADGPKL